MTFGDVRECLLPAAAERDEDFRQEILSLSHRGLRIVAAAQIVIGTLALATRLIPWPAAAAILILGVGAGTITRIGAAYAWSRLISFISCSLGSAIVAWTIFVVRRKISR